MCGLQVVLCGGSARIPRLQQMIRDMFPDVEQLSSAPPDEVIAVGAALEAGLLVGKEVLTPEEESVTVDVSATDILVKVHWSIKSRLFSSENINLFYCIYYNSCFCPVLQEVDESGAEVFTVLLPSGTPLPARRHHVLSGGGELSSFCLEIYQKFVTEQPEKLAKV